MIWWIVTLAGCTSRVPPAPDTVSAAWERQVPVPGPVDRPAPGSLVGAPAGEPREGLLPPAVATVNRAPIYWHDLTEALIDSQGAQQLEELIDLEVACAAALKSGLTVTPNDLQRERELTLQRLAEPQPGGLSVPLDEALATRLLQQVLESRDLSTQAFERLLRRNACLRKMVESTLTFSEVELREEFDRLYGKRARVRHMQLPTLADAQRMLERLAAGEGFDELARRFSANSASAANGGLLDPFSAEDPRLPPPFRRVAFSLHPHEVSGAVRVGEWYHVIRLEAMLPEVEADFEPLRGDMERSLRERTTEPAMFDLLDRLRRDAKIVVHDPRLAKRRENRQPRSQKD